MDDRIKEWKLLSILILLVLYSMQLYPQQLKKETFTLKEYSIKDSNFYNELCFIIFSDTVFGLNKTSYKRFLAMRCYDTNFVHFDYLTGQNFSADFNIFDIMEGSVLKVINNANGVIGYFYINDKICLILNTTQHNFILQYLISTKKRKTFTFREPIPVDDYVNINVGGFISAYMNILPNGKLEIVRVLVSE